MKNTLVQKHPKKPKASLVRLSRELGADFGVKTDAQLATYFQEKGHVSLSRLIKQVNKLA